MSKIFHSCLFWFCKDDAQLKGLLPSGASSIDNLELRAGSVGPLLIGALLPRLFVARKAIHTLYYSEVGYDAPLLVCLTEMQNQMTHKRQIFESTGD